MHNPKDAEICEEKKFLARWSGGQFPEAYLNKNCLPRAP